MKDLFIEYDIMQNNALASLILWQFTTEFYINTNKTKGPNLQLTMMVLPIIFNKDSMLSIYRRRFDGGLFNALEEDRTIVVGLQERMEKMTAQTFEALNLGFAAGLLDYKKENSEIVPVRITKSIQINKGDIKKMLAASKRLGRWLSSLSIEQICIFFKVRF